MNKSKPASRKNKITLINASNECKKGRPKNYLPDESIQRIAKAFIKGEDVEKFVKIITKKEAEDNDYNLSPSRYIDVSDKVLYRPIPEILSELKALEKDSKKIDAELDNVFQKLSKQISGEK